MRACKTSARRPPRLFPSAQLSKMGACMADRCLTFDCFGTLIDWRHGIRTTGELLFPGRGPDLLGAYIELEAEVEKEKPFRRYRVVLAETLRRAGARLKLELKHDDATALTSTIPHWPVFPH